MNSNVALDRDALYYPYIHINDVNWLKATLLSFPTVQRMVPVSYSPDDKPEILEFCNTEGPRGPLLKSADLFSPEARNAELSLLAQLKANDTFIREHYSKRRTLETQGHRPDLFTLHDQKIVLELVDYLTTGDEDALAWWTPKPPDRPERGYGHWLALHPVLGKAILATKAIAIAEGSGLNIVTDSDSVHHNVAFQNQKHIFEQLLGKPAPASVPDTSDKVDRISELVITTNFDVSRLSARDVADLLNDGKDLRRFKDALVPLADHIPQMANEKERQERFMAAAAEATNEWVKYKQSLLRFGIDAVMDATDVKWPDFANSIAAGGSVWHISAAAGFGIALVTYAGIKIFRKYRESTVSPYSYLSRIQQLQQSPQPNLTLPPIVYPGM